jgi:hypothetical protein
MTTVCTVLQRGSCSVDMQPSMQHAQTSAFPCYPYHTQRLETGVLARPGPPRSVYPPPIWFAEGDSRDSSPSIGVDGLDACGVLMEKWTG